MLKIAGKPGVWEIAVSSVCLYFLCTFRWLPPGVLPDVTGHPLCFCWEGGFLRALDPLGMVVWSKKCVLNVKRKMFPHFGKMLPNMFPDRLHCVQCLNCMQD